MHQTFRRLPVIGTLFDGIAELGGKALMWKAGHSLIKAKMKDTQAPLAGEMSGIIFFFAQIVMNFRHLGRRFDFLISF